MRDYKRLGEKGFSLRQSGIPKPPWLLIEDWKMLATVEDGKITTPNISTPYALLSVTGSAPYDDIIPNGGALLPTFIVGILLAPIV